MRILHIINNLGSGGAEKLLEGSLPLLKKKEIDVELLVLSDKNNVFDRLIIDSGVRIKVLTDGNIRSPLNIYRIWKYINENAYDVVHVHLFPSIYWGSLASKCIFKDKPVFIMTEHNTFNRRRSYNMLRPIEKWIYSSYDKIISISESTEHNLKEWLQVKRSNDDKYIVIDNGIDISKFQQAKPLDMKNIISSYENSMKLICMVGSFSKQKDQLTLIKSIGKLPDHIHLILIGVGPLLEETRYLTEKLGLSNRVHFLGFRKDVERILKSVDIVVQSSHWEGFGLAAVEGMAVGKPVVSSNVPGLCEVVSNAGRLFEVGDDKELADTLRNILEDEEEYKLLVELSLRRAERYSLENMVDEYKNCYIKLA